MSAGFVHGVLNSDNMNVTGESFDYGPYRFLPTFELGFTAAYFDQSGLYAYGRQPQAVLWNVARLADTLTLLTTVEALEKILDTFQARFVVQRSRQLPGNALVVTDGKCDIGARQSQSLEPLVDVTELSALSTQKLAPCRRIEKQIMDGNCCALRMRSRHRLRQLTILRFDTPRAIALP